MNTREEIIEECEQSLNNFKKNIMKVDDRLFKYCSVSKGIFNDILITTKETTFNYNQFLEKLKFLKSKLGNYEIIQYWIPYDDHVCVNYKFLDQEVRFSITSSDEIGVEDIIEKLSNGKCKVSKTESFVVRCSLK